LSHVPQLAKTFATKKTRILPLSTNHVTKWAPCPCRPGGSARQPSDKTGTVSDRKVVGSESRVSLGQLTCPTKSHTRPFIHTFNRIPFVRQQPEVPKFCRSVTDTHRLKCQ
jgi:hypothetical protein